MTQKYQSYKTISIPSWEGDNKIADNRLMGQESKMIRVWQVT